MHASKILHVFSSKNTPCYLRTHVVVVCSVCLQFIYTSYWLANATKWAAYTKDGSKGWHHFLPFMTYKQLSVQFPHTLSVEWCAWHHFQVSPSLSNCVCLLNYQSPKRPEKNYQHWVGGMKYFHPKAFQKYTLENTERNTTAQHKRAWSTLLMLLEPLKKSLSHPLKTYQTKKPLTSDMSKWKSRVFPGKALEERSQARLMSS